MFLLATLYSYAAVYVVDALRPRKSGAADRPVGNA